MRRKAIALLLSSVAASGLALPVSVVNGRDNPDAWKRAHKLYHDGNFREALTAYAPLLAEKEAPTQELVSGFQRAAQCLQQLKELDKLDELRESVVATQSSHWRVLAAVAQSYLYMPHHGYRIAGEFRRGHHRGGGDVVHAAARDRVRALQLHWQALQLVRSQPGRPSVAESRWLSDQVAAAVLFGTTYYQGWQLQILTDLSKLPDVEDGWGDHSLRPLGAPVDAEGKPIVYALPNTWESAQSDGERWRWLLDLAAQWQPQRRSHIEIARARFLQSQFGVETLASFGRWVGTSPQKNNSAETGTYALHTLGENETMARLAIGVRRFELPAEHNPVKIYQEVLAGTVQADRYSAAEALATIFENRRQYDRAAKYWQHFLQGQPDSHAKQRLKQITGNWGRLEPVMSQPAGEGAKIDYLFRNGRRVEFTAQRIDVPQLLSDVKAHLKNGLPKWDWNQVQIANLGYRLVVEEQEKYLGEEVARWSLDLDPLAAHLDRRITVSTPLQKPGAYLLTSHMVDGNKTSVVLWLSDTAIVKKQLSGKSLYYVADSVSGQPVADCNVELFGFWHENGRGRKGGEIHTKNLAELTDERGMAVLSHADENRRHTWLAIATTPTGRFAYLGFQAVWAAEYRDPHYEQVNCRCLANW